MYTPRYFQVENPEEILSFVHKNPFATLFSTDGGRPVATHIPLEVEQREGKTYLTGHMARANPQWKTFAESQVLAVFQAAHAYVSSSWYGHLNVPTWNYMAVHAYGRAIVLPPERVRESLRSMLDKYEQGRDGAVLWESLPEEMLASLMNGLVGFEMEVERWEASYKLSQNRNEADFRSIVAHLRATDRPEEIQVADAMEHVSRSGENLVFTVKKSQ
jgi:transcriptional regulator